MNDPLQPWQGEVWQRGAKLGLVWLGVLVAATALVFLVMGLAGWSGTLHALCALCVGPVIGLSLIAGWWVVRRPTLNLAGRRDERGGKAHEHDGMDG